jgi:hypothetical protein
VIGPRMANATEGAFEVAIERKTVAGEETHRRNLIEKVRTIRSPDWFE